MNNLESNNYEATVVDVVENVNLDEALDVKKFPAKKAGLIVLAVGAATGGVAYLCRKNKAKFYDWMAKKLEKNGYMVLSKEDQDAINNDENPEDILSL